MLNRLLLASVTVGVMAAVAGSNTYKVDIIQDSTINGHQVKAGTYKIAIENNMAVLKHGKDSIEVPARTEQGTSKYANTQMRYVENNNLQEIHVGGTTTKIVFGATAPASASGGSF